MFGLEYFSFRVIWSPFFLSVVLIIALVYLLLVGPWRHRFEGSTKVSSGKKAWFLAGLLIYYMTQGGPMNLLGHLIFSVHMLNMALVYLVVPLFILLGIPGWLLRPALRIQWAKSLLYSLTNPIITVLLFNALFSFYHWPSVLDFVMTHFIIHRLFDAIMLIAAFMMWWPIVTPLPETERLSDLQKMGYVFANGVLLTPACGLITFADHTLYSTFSDPNVWATAMGYCVPDGTPAELLSQFSGGPKFFFILSALEDQQLGGVLMKLTQEAVYGTVLAYIFFKWYRKENPKRNEIDPIDEQSLERVGYAGGSGK
ncbi:cytochrome c oxidase assembly factor CtaG [Ferviditalea candida]|uniref:Cytochrome c oxidase assembly factor CtaG n=1 Tax=Ferviditalea candida TaxID=3108399 RepID=A0ABU5ZIM0_9BACL|nr:cytochrome c oxidase assembly factor CtaG [Paenibacillaceae bacterium T2]